MKNKFICMDGTPVSVFVLSDHITSAVQGENLECCYHGSINISDVAPDLVSNSKC